MKKDYIAPKCTIMLLSMQAFCASFDSNNNTENWNIEDEETI